MHDFNSLFVKGFGCRVRFIAVNAHTKSKCTSDLCAVQLRTIRMHINHQKLNSNNGTRTTIVKTTTARRVEIKKYLSTVRLRTHSINIRLCAVQLSQIILMKSLLTIVRVRVLSKLQKVSEPAPVSGFAIRLRIHWKAFLWASLHMPRQQMM